MKKSISVYFLLLIAIIWFKPLTAQNEGSITYIQSSNWAKMMAGLDYISQAQRDKMMYMFGNRSGWKQYKILHYTPDIAKYVNSEDKAEPEMRGWSFKQELFFMESSFKNNTIFNVLSFNGKQYIVNDSINPYAWKIKNNLKEIAGHICMNATTHDSLRNQNIEAWFALDIPVSSGPDRFYGLPGIILEVDINSGAMVLSADKIEAFAGNPVFERPKKLKGKKVTQDQLNAIYRTQIEEKRKMEQPWFIEVPY
jgi:GLPGLI family protein